MIKDLLLLTSFLLSLNLSGQELPGRYSREDLWNGETSTVLELSGDYTFVETTHHNLGVTTIRNGRYAINNDTIIFNFGEPQQKDVVIRDTEKIKQTNLSGSLVTNLSIKLYDPDGDQEKNAIIHFMDKNGFFLAQPITSEMQLSLYNDQLETFMVSSPGHHDIQVDLKPLLGYSSKIDIYLSRTGYVAASPNPQKFIVKRLGKDTVELISLSDTIENWKLKKTEL